MTAEWWQNEELEGWYWIWKKHPELLEPTLDEWSGEEDNDG